MKIRLNYFILIVIWAFFSTLHFSCSTKKSTVVSRSYHNLTSRFNGYFYANESFKEGVAIIEKAHVDRYDKILPVFKYGESKDSKTIYPQMDKTFKKSSAVIERHSILIRNVEHVKWIDENYMLIGKSHFYKRDYFAGLEVFDYVSKQYKKSPTRFDARIWMIRTYNELGIFDKAQSLIDLLKEDKDFPSRLLGELASVQADFYIKQELYTQAISQMQKAVALNSKKAVRTRYLYILAQLYKAAGEPHKAARYFQQVIKRNPPYVMAFNAKINLATSNDGTPKRRVAIKKQLSDMLKDDKNREYYDQIYYALSEIAIQDNDTNQALVFLVLSTRASTTNPNQKGKSFLKMADLHYGKASYRLAQAYYDSSLSFINKDFTGYETALNKKRNLTNLVNNLNVITVEDSLQRIAGLSEKDRDDYIEELMAKAVEEENRRKEQEELDKQNALNIPQNQANPNQAQTPGGGSTWYFYNPSTLSFGFTEFLKRWGNRKLEDNWRRINRQTISNIADDEDIAGGETGGETAEAAKGGGAVKDKAAYLKSLPLTAEQKKKSTDKIIEAYYNMGMIYKEQLLNNQKSIETFEELLKRFPKNKYELASYYQLYRLYLSMNNSVKADKYKNILLRNYPESEYSQIIKNPDFGKALAVSKNKLEDFYAETYEQYKKGNYQEVINRTTEAERDFPKSEIAPKLEFLRALSIGYVKSVNDLEIALKVIVAKYPQDPVKDQAQEILKAIAKQKEGQKEVTHSVQDSTTVPGKEFKIAPAAEHFLVIIVTEQNFNPESLRKMISDFNAASFSTVKLDVSSIIFDADKQMVSVKTFPNQEKGMNYYHAIKADNKISRSLELKNYRMFLINQQNYALLYKEKKVEDYMKFFTENYK